MRAFVYALVAAAASAVSLRSMDTAAGTAAPITAADVSNYASTKLWKAGQGLSKTEIQAGLVTEGFKPDVAAAIVAEFDKHPELRASPESLGAAMAHLFTSAGSPQDIGSVTVADVATAASTAPATAAPATAA